MSERRQAWGPSLSWIRAQVWLSGQRAGFCYGAAGGDGLRSGWVGRSGTAVQTDGGADSGERCLHEVADAVLAHRLAREPALALARAEPPSGFASVAAPAADDDAAFCRSALARLQRVEVASLVSGGSVALLAALRRDLSLRAEAARHWWLDFVITPYRGGDLHAEVRQVMQTYTFVDTESCERYVHLVRDYGRLLLEIVDKTTAQSAHGLRLAAPAVTLARVSVRRLVASLPRALVPEMSRLERLAAPQRARLQATVEALISAIVAPAGQRLHDLLGEDYERHAPCGVGLHQYPGGEAYYQFLVAQRADDARSASEIHAFGRASVNRLADARAALRARLAPELTAAQFDRWIRTDPQFLAESPQVVEQVFIRHLRRIEPLLPRWFGRLPRANWAVSRLDPALEAGMSYGYFQPATPADPVGRYCYNGSGLEQRTLVVAQHLIHHEVLPGHHLQLSLQREGCVVHPLQAHLQSMASIEGWAVYAAELAHEMGLYEGTNLYGHFASQSFLAARLVVDTGLNVMGWSLAEARAFLREHTIEGEALIDAEVLRYATDIPAQALAYDLGRAAIESARTRAQQILGSRFDLRGFHDAWLEVGGYGLPVIAQRIDDWVASAGRA